MQIVLQTNMDYNPGGNWLGGGEGGGGLMLVDCIVWNIIWINGDINIIVIWLVYDKCMTIGNYDVNLQMQYRSDKDRLTGTLASFIEVVPV